MSMYRVGDLGSALFAVCGASAQCAASGAGL
jgi:hypothetical protein